MSDLDSSEATSLQSTFSREQDADQRGSYQNRVLHLNFELCVAEKLKCVLGEGQFKVGKLVHVGTY